MRRVEILIMLLLLCSFSAISIKGRQQELSKVESSAIKGKVFRSDTNEAISNAYILIMQEKDSPAQAEHFDLRTDENGNYSFSKIPAGKYTVYVYAWFPKMSDVPCQNPSKAKTIDDGVVTVEWQWRSQAFKELVTIKGFSVQAGQDGVNNFDLMCR